jgi:hypothetical protein
LRLMSMVYRSQSVSISDWLTLSRFDVDDVRCLRVCSFSPMLTNKRKHTRKNKTSGSSVSLGGGGKNSQGLFLMCSEPKSKSWILEPPAFPSAIPAIPGSDMFTMRHQPIKHRLSVGASACGTNLEHYALNSTTTSLQKPVKLFDGTREMHVYSALL